MSGPAVTAEWTGPLTRHVPELFHEDRFLQQFLQYYDDLLDRLAGRIDDLPGYWDPATAPVGMLDRLERWVGMEHDSSLPALSRRRLLRSALVRGAGRGTVQVLQESVAVALNLAPASVMVIDSPSGHPPRPLPFHFRIVITLPNSSDAGSTTWPNKGERVALVKNVLRIVEDVKPAHTFLDDISIQWSGSSQTEKVWPT